MRFTLAFGFERVDLGRTEPLKIAVSLARSGTFADPYSIPTGPTAHSAPFYPLSLAPIYFFWGDSREADLARVAFNILLASFEYALLPIVAGSLGLGRWPGIVAGMAGAVFPIQYWPESMGGFETTWVALFLLTSTIFFARMLAGASYSAASAIRTGLFWGAGLLISPTVVLVLLGFLAILITKKPPPWRMLLVFVVTLLLALAPWSVRNYHRFGKLSFVRNNLGLELFVSNSSDASFEYTETSLTPTFVAHHPFASQEAAKKLKRMGETAFHEEKLRLARDWIREHPRRFLALSLARIRNFWFPVQIRRSVELVQWAITALGLAGLAALFRRNRTAATVLASILVSYPATYAFFANYIRSQHPIHWAILLLCGWLFADLRARRSRGAIPSL